MKQIVVILLLFTATITTTVFSGDLRIGIPVLIPNTNHVWQYTYRDNAIDNINGPRTNSSGGVNGDFLQWEIHLSIPTNRLQVQQESFELHNEEFFRTTNSSGVVTTNGSRGPVWENVSPVLEGRTNFILGGLDKNTYYRFVLR